MIKSIGILLTAALAASAFAQTGTYTWQISTDSVNWSDTAFLAPATTYHLRVLASWAGITGTDIGYAGGQFTVFVNGGTIASPVSNIQRPPPFAFASQTIVATYGGGITIAPVGGGFINPGQAAKDFAAAGTYNSDNPCVIFSFDIQATEEMVFGLILNQTTGRGMAVYTNSTGTQTRINASAVTVNTASIVIPAPGALSLLSLCGMVATHRRRS